MKKGIYLILCCVCLLMNIRVAYGEVVKRDTLVEDFSAADIAQYNKYSTHTVWTAKNGITWHCENMAVNKVGKLESVGLVYYYNANRIYGRVQTGKIRGLHKLTFETGSNKGSSYSVKVSYSPNGTDWIETPFSLQTSYMKKDSIVFPETGDYYVKFYIGGMDKLYFYLDNITFYTEQTETGEQMDIVDWGKNSLTLNMNGCAPEMGVSVGIDGGEEKTIEEGKAYSYLGQNDRTYRVETQNLRAGDDVQIVAKYGDSQGNTYVSNRKYRVPYIYGDSVVWKFSYMTDDDIVVRGGKTVLQTDVAVRNVYVYPDGELVVADKCALTCAKLFVRTTATESGVLSGNIKAHETYYTRIVANKTHYFQFALPVSSTTRDVVTTAGDTCVLDRHWRLNMYDTQRRAENGTITDNWVRYTGETIEAHKGYAMLSASPYYREYLFPVTCLSTVSNADVKVPVSAPKGTDDVAHEGWNYICSPYQGLYVSAPTEDPSDRVYISELRADGGSYWQHVADTIFPAKPFYYQAPAEGNLVFGDMLRLESSVSQPVMAREYAREDMPTQWLQVCMKGDDGMEDETHIYLHPRKFAEAYEVGRDLLKLRGSGQSVMVYSDMACGALSVNALPDSVARAEIALGYHAPQAGTYTLRLKANDYMNRLEDVLLLDNQTHTQVSLIGQDYTFASAGGECTDRFSIRCVFHTQETPTDIHPIGDAAGVVQKVFHAGQVCILRHGKRFDMLGRMVR